MYHSKEVVSVFKTTEKLPLAISYIIKLVVDNNCPPKPLAFCNNVLVWHIASESFFKENFLGMTSLVKFALVVSENMKNHNEESETVGNTV